MTKDLALCVSMGRKLNDHDYVSTEEFMRKCAERLRENLKHQNSPKL